MAKKYMSLERLQEYDALIKQEIVDAVSGKAPASHNHDDRYYTETEIDNKLASKSDTSHKHDSLYDAKGAAAAVQTNLDTVSDTLDAHTENTNIHVTTANKTNWNAAYDHSQAAHARVDATKVADSTTNGNILINGTETTVYAHPNSGVTAGTYKSVTVDAQGHITNGTNPTTLAGYGITDAEAKGSVNTHNTSATAHSDIRDLISELTTKVNNFLDVDDTTTDQLSEVLELIENNKGDLESLTSGKVNVSDIVDNLTTSNASKVLSAKQGVTLKGLIDALQEALDTHKFDTTKHITSTERTNWGAAYTHSQAAHAPSNAEKNQNAFSNVKVGSTTVAADTTTDTLEIAAGTGISVSGDATNDKVTITNSGVIAVSTGSANGTISVNTNGTAANVAVKGLKSAAYTDSSAYATHDHTHTIDSALSTTSTNPVQNKVVNSAIGELTSAVSANTNSISAHSTAISNLQTAIGEIQEITSADIQALFA